MQPRANVVMSAGDPALILQNKGGGHGEFGYHLALELAIKHGRPVTILHEGAGPNFKEAHRAYGDLDAAGVKVLWCEDLTDADACLSKLKGASFGSVIDNWSKSSEAISPYAEAAKDWGVSTFAYVSSAGMYMPEKDSEGPITEDCPVKLTSQRQAEEKLAELGLPWTCFRPQYVYGPKQGKSYLAYFFDRLTRGAPVPVPGAGDQMVTMTHAADNAAMISAAIDNEAAVGQVFNCATSALITYDDLALLCASAAGVDSPRIVHYDPKAVAPGSTKAIGFPFRETPFYVSVAKAKEVLGFRPKNVITQDIKWYYADNYVGAGKADKEVDLSKDEVVLKVAT